LLASAAVLPPAAAAAVVRRLLSATRPACNCAGRLRWRRLSGLLLMLLVAASVAAAVATRCCASFRFGLRRQMYLLWLVARLQQRIHKQGTVSSRLKGAELRPAALRLGNPHLTCADASAAADPVPVSPVLPESAIGPSAAGADRHSSNGEERAVTTSSSQRACARAPHLWLTSGCILLDVYHPWQLCTGGQLLLMLHSDEFLLLLLLL
jgi:hypothetical protein